VKGLGKNMGQRDKQFLERNERNVLMKVFGFCALQDFL
jgi:hypothetical protein